MKTVELQGTLRKSTGKKDAKNLRRSENVPCVLYGSGENKYFFAPNNSFREIVYTPNVYLIALNIEGAKSKAIIQDIQFNPVTDEISHIDFLEVKDDKKITVALPLRITGNSVGVREGGKLSVDKKKIKVKGFTKDLPELIEIDITSLGLGKTIRIGDLSVANVEFIESKGIPVVSVKATRASREASEAAATPAKK